MLNKTSYLVLSLIFGVVLLFSAQSSSLATPSNKIQKDRLAWWNKLDDSWKRFFYERFEFQGNPKPIHLDSIFAIQIVDCSNKGIKTLEPLKYLLNMETLWCDQNVGLSGKALEPLAGHPKLKDLDFSTTAIDDIEALRTCEELTKIIFFDTQVRSLYPLSGLTKLQVIDCSGSPVITLDPLAYITSLQTIYCARTKITSVDSVGNLANLTQFTFSETLVKDIKSLEKLTKLTEVVCSNTQLTDVLPLKNNQDLMILYCADSPVTEASANKLKEAIPTCEVIF